jgi:hypothetical protein
MKQSEVDALQIVVKSDAVMSALRAVFIESVERKEPSIDGDDALIGQKYRAYRTAIGIIDDAFLELEKAKKEKVEGDEDVRHI